MKFAIISDIHANLPALEAVMRSIRQQEPDDIYCLGDLVNFAGWDNEVIDLIKKNGISCVQGNHDEAVGYHRQAFSYSFTGEAQQQFGVASIHYVNRTITEKNRRFLKTLPFSLVMDFHFPFHGVKLAMVHGSPVSNNDYIREKESDQKLIEWMDELDADVLLTGHTHQPFHRAVFSERDNHKIYRHVINAGSVGKPKQGDNQACYVTVVLNEHLQPGDPDFVEAAFHYCAYDVQQAIDHIHQAGLGNAYDDFLLYGDKTVGHD